MTAKNGDAESGAVTSRAASRRAVFERAKERFFDEHQCPQLALEATGVPGMAIAVVYGDETPVLRGYGVREIGKKGEERKEVNEDTVFQLASVSKPITSTVLAVLVDEKIIGWDDKVSGRDESFLLREPGSTRPPDKDRQTVTLADLLAHCSGLPQHAGDMLEDIGYDRDAVLSRLCHLPVAPRMTKGWYTNFGFTAAAVAAAKATSTAWEDLAREKLYEPLGMRRTSSRYADFENDPNCAVGHQRFSRYPGQWEWVAAAEQRRPDAQSPAGGVRASIADLSRWMRLQLGGGRSGEGRQIVSEAALARTHTRHGPPNGKFGLGWDVGENGFSHSGAFVAGAATRVELWPALGVGVAVLTNGEPVGVPEAVCRAFYDYLTGADLPNGRTLMRWLKAATEMMRESIPVPQDAGYGTWHSDPPRELKEYCGTYTHEYYGRIEIKLDDGGGPGHSRRLKLLAGPPRREVPLRMWRGDAFVYQTFGENAVGLSAVEFRITESGKALSVKNLPFSGTDPDYSEIVPDHSSSDPSQAKEAVFTGS